jgi:hypothetical protein
MEEPPIEVSKDVQALLLTAGLKDLHVTSFHGAMTIVMQFLVIARLNKASRRLVTAKTWQELHSRWSLSRRKWEGIETTLPPYWIKQGGNPLWWLCSCLIAEQVIRSKPFLYFLEFDKRFFDTMLFFKRENGYPIQIRFFQPLGGRDVFVEYEHWSTYMVRFGESVPYTFKKTDSAMKLRLGCANWIYDNIFVNGYGFMLPKTNIYVTIKDDGHTRDPVDEPAESHSLLIGAPVTQWAGQPSCIACSLPLGELAAGHCPCSPDRIYCGASCQTKDWTPDHWVLH